MTSFNLNYLLKTLSPNTITLGVRASSYKFGRGREGGGDWGEGGGDGEEHTISSIADGINSVRSVPCCVVQCSVPGDWHRV